MSGSETIWVDGRPASQLPLPDRGLALGDGLFETLLVRRQVPLFTELHFARLAEGLERLGFPDCLSRARADLQQFFLALPERSTSAWGAIRLIVSRGSGPRGYAPPTPCKPRIIIEYSPLPYSCDLMRPAARLGVATVRWSAQPALAGLKHISRLEQVLAASEAGSADLDDMLMLGSVSEVVSLSSGNIFAVRDGLLMTPDLAHSGISGTRRNLVLARWGMQAGLDIRIAELTMNDVVSADELFYSNAIVGVRPIGSIGAHRWRDFPVCKKIFSLYQDDLS